MQTKLTLRMDENLIVFAKDYSRKNSKSLSQLVADYFYVIQQQSADIFDDKEITPFVRSLIGIIPVEASDAEVRDDYHRYLEEKYS